MTYKTRTFDLRSLRGISDETLELHFKLYAGYVESANRLTERIGTMLDHGHVDREEIPVYSELTRRLGYEYNGMVLHEYYFENLTRQGGGSPGDGFRAAATARFGDVETWQGDFAGIGAMRGVGWAICCQDPRSGHLSNHWVTLHEQGNVAGFRPILVMDVWEHAFLLDHGSDRARYITAFFANVDWRVVESRLRAEAAPSRDARV